MFLFLASTIACIQNSKVPAGALEYTVTATGVGPDTCHPGNTQGWTKNFTYDVTLNASSASLYADGEPFASGSISGCKLNYQTVVIDDAGRTGGDLKWQLTGAASMDTTSGGVCATDGNAFSGTETYAIISSDDPNIAVGCTYPTTVVGDFVTTTG